MQKSKSTKIALITLGLLLVGGGATAAVAIAMSKKDEKSTTDTTEDDTLPLAYSFYKGVDYSWNGVKDDSIKVAPYVSDEDMKSTCDTVKTADGKPCAVAVRYGSNVYYRPNLVQPPYDWLGKSPSPATDGSYIRERIKVQ